MNTIHIRVGTIVRINEEGLVAINVPDELPTMTYVVLSTWVRLSTSLWSKHVESTREKLKSESSEVRKQAEISMAAIDKYHDYVVEHTVLSDEVTREKVITNIQAPSYLVTLLRLDGQAESMAEVLTVLEEFTADSDDRVVVVDFSHIQVNREFTQAQFDRSS